MEKILSDEPFTSIPSKESLATRFITFNVNGIKTLFNYHPWNKFNNDLNAIFQSLQGDIITLQELKLSETSLTTLKDIGHLKDYKSFISLPSLKKGYSGVGLFIKNHINILNAEEGLTGFLSNRSGQFYRDLKQNIGGYPELSEEDGIHIDCQGRCVVVELSNNLVIFALYCPANSSATEEGDNYKLQFLSTLLERCRSLKFNLGKEVIIMGDINVSLDLIDSAEGIKDRLMNNLIKPSSIGQTFELINYEECCKFKETRSSRSLMNKFVIRSLWQQLSEKAENNQFLYDTTRFIQGRRLNMYTVWNTLTNSRLINFGSRIDLILCSCSKLVETISNADIMPSILGSDHCPVFTDFNLENVDIQQPQKFHFEAKYHYKLSKTRDISTLFGKQSKDPTPSDSSQEMEPKPDECTKAESTDQTSTLIESNDASRDSTPQESIKDSQFKLIYKSRKEPPQKKQKTIGNYFCK